MLPEGLRYKSYDIGRGQSCRRLAIGRSTKSPDYSHLDYFVWGVSELFVNAIKIPRNKFKDLIKKMKVVKGSPDWDTVAKSH